MSTNENSAPPQTPRPNRREEGEDSFSPTPRPPTVVRYADNPLPSVRNNFFQATPISNFQANLSMMSAHPPVESDPERNTAGINPGPPEVDAGTASSSDAYDDNFEWDDDSYHYYDEKCDSATGFSDENFQILIADTRHTVSLTLHSRPVPLHISMLIVPRMLW